MPGMPRSWICLLLGRRDLALDPDEAGVAGELLAERRGIEVGQHAGDQLGRLVGVDDVARLGDRATPS